MFQRFFSAMTALAWLLAGVGMSAAIPNPAIAEAEQVVPYWASLRATEVNMRVGPGEDYRISWVYHRQHLPVKVLREMEGWRLVQDQDGARGWIMLRFLSHARGAVVVGEGPADMRAAGSDDSTLRWHLAPGVVGLLGDCAGGWCQFNVDGRAGYVGQDRLWGAAAP